MRNDFDGATLEIKWTVSRGADTYGYNICSLWCRGKKLASCSGGGYDMAGTVLADFIKMIFPDELRTLTANAGGNEAGGFYGLRFSIERGDKWERLRKWEQGASVSLDGGCGFESMEKILNALGYTVQYVNVKSQKNQIYIFRKLTTGDYNKVTRSTVV